MSNTFNKPVVLATYSFLSDALVLRSRLEYEGITCLIPEENTASIANYLTAMTVRILVDESDLEMAKKVMTDVIQSTQPDEKSFTCAKCGSHEWKKRSTFGTNFFRFLFGFLSGAPVRKQESRRICAGCAEPIES